MQKRDFWYRLLSRLESKTLSATEERKLLVELVDCRNRILEALYRVADADRYELAAATDFQKLIRELATTTENRVDHSTETVRRLALRYQELRCVLAMANVRLVAHVAKGYSDRRIPLVDLVQDGFCGLLTAIDRFDLANETRLATYAVWWIRVAIQRGVATGAFPVRLTPRHLNILSRARRAPLGASADRFPRTGATDPVLSPTIEKMAVATRRVVSLDAPCAADDTTSIGEFLTAADEEYAPYDASMSVGNLIQTLDPRDQLVLKLRFGLGGESPCTLAQVGRVLGVSQERVRQLEQRALATLRTASAGSEIQCG